MNKTLLNLLLVILPFCLAAQEAKKVLVIGIDGCRPDALQVAATPNIDELILSGIYSPDALNDDITISGPGWSAILCGVWSDKHLVVNNSFSIDDYATYPAFFNYVETFDPELHTVSICHWSPINDRIVAELADFKLNVSSDADLADQASSYLSVNDPDVMFLHFDELDIAGHNFGFSPDISEYTATIENIDSLIGIVIEAMENRPSFPEEDWLILLTTDHGGQGTSHGGTSLEEENVFVIASGKSVEQKIIVRDSMMVGQNIENCLGDTIELRFDNQDDRVQIPANPIFDFGTDQDFTIECRVRTPISADIAMIGNKDWDSGINKGFVFSFRFPSGPEWKVNIGDGTNRADINTGGTIADNEWHTLSVSFNRDGFMKMYQDGEFVDSTDISFIGDINTNMGLFFGTDINAAFDFTGAISEVRVWNEILSQESIEEWYCKTIDATHTNYEALIGYWKLNDGIGNVEVTDLSVNNNPGVVIGATWNSIDSMIIYDYSNTPRLTDIAPTLFSHLCIPIDEDWDLDGQSLLSDCLISSTQNSTLEDRVDLNIYPNPAANEVFIKPISLNANRYLDLEIYKADGSKISAYSISNAGLNLDVSKFEQGVYYLNLVGKNKISVSKKLIIQR